MDLYLEKNDSALVTTRRDKQTLYLFLSSLVGSTVGMMGTIGFLMRKTEAWYKLKLQQKDILRNQLQKISKRRKLISCFMKPSYGPFKIYPISTDILAGIEIRTQNPSNYVMGISPLFNLDYYSDESILYNKPVFPTPELSLSPEEILPEMIYSTQ